jgi:hypothetical protein
MGPAGLWWYEENKIPFIVEKTFSSLFNKEIEFKKYDKQYAGGRIDCYCNDINDPDYDPYNRELFLPIMESKSFNIFSDWLENIKTEKLLTEKELFSLFLEETNIKLKYFDEKDNPIMER